MSDTPPKHRMTKDELRELICEGVTEALTRIGLDADDPLKMQRDFQWLRDTREATESFRRKGWLTVLGIVVTAAAAALWVGIKALAH